MATAAATRGYKNFIGGEWVAPEHGKTLENRNPANTDEMVGVFPASSAEDVDAAVAAAKQAYKTWRLTPAPKRAEILFRAAELLVKRKEEFSRDMTREMGKVLAETRGDVQEAIDMTYYMAGEGRRLFGQTTPSELPNKFAMSMRQHRGAEARRGYAAVFIPFGGGFGRSRCAVGSHESGERRWTGSGRAAGE